MATRSISSDEKLASFRLLVPNNEIICSLCDQAIPTESQAIWEHEDRNRKIRHIFHQACLQEFLENRSNERCPSPDCRGAALNANPSQLHPSAAMRHGKEDSTQRAISPCGYEAALNAAQGNRQALLLVLRNPPDSMSEKARGHSLLEAVKANLWNEMCNILEQEPIDPNFLLQALHIAVNNNNIELFQAMRESLKFLNREELQALIDAATGEGEIAAVLSQAMKKKNSAL